MQSNAAWAVVPNGITGDQVGDHSVLLVPTQLRSGHEQPEESRVRRPRGEAVQQPGVSGRGFGGLSRRHQRRSRGEVPRSSG